MKLIKSVTVLAEIAANQWGMVTTAQAKARGLSNMDLSRLVEVGVLERLAHGVYRDTGVPSEAYEELRVAWLAIEPKKTAWERTRDRPSFATVAGESAALVHGLGSLRGMKNDFITQGRKQTQRDDIRYRNKTLSPEDVTVASGLPVLTIERMVADLVEMRTPLPHVGEVIRDALRKTDIRAGRLIELLAPLALRYGLKKNDGSGLLHMILTTVALDFQSIADQVASSGLLGKTVVEKYSQRKSASEGSGRMKDLEAHPSESQNFVLHAALLENTSRLFGEPSLNETGEQ